MTMQEQQGPSFASRLGRRALAILILAVIGWILLKVVISIATGIATILVVIAAIFAAIWAFRQL